MTDTNQRGHEKKPSPQDALRGFLQYATGPAPAIPAAEILKLAQRLPAEITRCEFINERDCKQLITNMTTGDVHIHATVEAEGFVHWEVFTGLEADHDQMNFPKLRYLDETRMDSPPVERIVHMVERYRRGITHGHRLGPDPRCHGYAEAAEHSNGVHEKWLASPQRNIMLGQAFGRITTCHDAPEQGHHDQSEELRRELAIDFAVQPMEPGFSHRSEDTLRRALGQYEPARLRHWLGEMCDYDRNPSTAALTLEALGNIEPPFDARWRAGIIATGLRSRNSHVREAAVHAAEQWGETGVADLLTDHHDVMPQLQDYAHGVAADLKKQSPAARLHQATATLP